MINRYFKKTRPAYGASLLMGLLFMLGSGSVFAQPLTQTIHGKVYDELTREPLAFASVAVMNFNPVSGTIADIEGNFTLENVNIGRITIRVSMIGYEAYDINELLISSGPVVQLNIGLQQSTTTLDEVTVRVRKGTPLNSMTTLSSRQFTMEETQRYAGGMDDPARLVSSFAGVATPAISNNGISVRGNNPDGLLWRIDGVEVPAPNHFANLTIAGGGMLTVISNQMMANSDFYTGAFPAEYGNASSGVFDIKLKSGNTIERQYSFEAGILGVGVSAEGPFSKGGKSSYNINYRNSTMALVAPLLPDNAGVLRYQDLAFKTSFPTKKSGTFTLWGIGAIDGVDMEALDSTNWETHTDRDNSQTGMYMFTTALSHKQSLGEDMFINTTISASGNGLEHNEQRLDMNLKPQPQAKALNHSYQYTIQSNLTKRFGQKHSNKTGFRYSLLMHDVDVEQSLAEGAAPTRLANQNGSSGFMQAFTQSKIQVTKKLSLNAGINAQYFLLNNNYSIEPRAGIKYQLNSKNNIAFAYGIHSRLEQLPVYFVSQGTERPNKDLEFMKSEHYILSYNTKLTDNLRLCIEPYYQHLRQVPVSPTSYASTLNNNNTLFYNEVLVSKGTGRNLGIDLTLEKYLTNGYYYMFTASVYDSKYTAMDGIERNTRFNRNHVFNALFGREWEIINNRMLNANFRVNYLGGNRGEPVDESASLALKEVVYNESDNTLAFNNQFDGMPVVSFTFSYRKNKPKYSSVWSIQVLNATSAEEYAGDAYNLKKRNVETVFEGIMIPNITYKIEF